MKKLTTYFVFIVLAMAAWAVSCSKLSEEVAGPEKQSLNEQLGKSVKNPPSVTSAYQFHLLSPANGSCVEPNVTLKWQKYPGPPPGFAWCHYRVYINGQPVVTISSQNTTQWNATPAYSQRNQTYTWYVAAHYRSGALCLYGEASVETWTYRVKPLTPATPSLTGSVYQCNPMLSWNAVPNATRYDIYKSTSTGGDIFSTTGTSYIDFSECPVTRDGSTFYPGIFYDVRAVNVGVSCTSESNPSNMVGFWPDEQF